MQRPDEAVVRADLEARARGTTVYLPGRRYDMLPAVLSEALCSLRQGQDRLAFRYCLTFVLCVFV